MSLFTFTEYIKYRLKAKTRHGVHSPFVYQLIEKVLKDDSSIPLQQKLASFLGKTGIVQAAGDLPQSWIGILSKMPDKETAILVPGIHQSPLHLHCWNELVNDGRVKLSIDLFNAGLLFFKDEFKEKQHFILKYA